jgi:site-specific recombinase XerD
MEDWREELADFLRFCASEGRLAPMTCSAYERDVSACLDYLQGEGIRDLGDAKVTHLRAFLGEEQNRRPAVSSLARTAALKCFFRFQLRLSDCGCHSTLLRPNDAQKPRLRAGRESREGARRHHVPVSPNDHQALCKL